MALVSDLIVRMVLSTNPVPVCNFGVHRISFIFLPVQNSLNSLLLYQLPLSVRIVRGVPLSEIKLFKKFITLRVSVFSQIGAVGHLLKRSIATKMYTSPRVLDLIGPAKSKWISWFGSVKIFSPLTYVLGICVLRFLPAAVRLGQLSDFSCLSRYIPGHQKASDAFFILSTAACL